jgi:hypothetical protein
MKYLLSPESRQHIANHFGKQEKSGSCFYPEVFSNVDELLNALEMRDPKSIVIQSAGREAHTYDFSDMGHCGAVGVGQKSEYPNHEIILENRNGFVVEYIGVEKLPSTSLITVICSKVEGAFHLITAFPGDYAPAFPHSRMEPHEVNNSKVFWDKHILLKKI